MQNYSQVFADTLALYVSPYVPADQGDAGKGQVTVRAGYTIWSMINGNVGYIAKAPGQTQYHGVSVDALLDKSDGTWADYLTDELQGDGTRLIKLAYTPHNEPPPPGTSLPPANWVAPTPTYLEYPGPLVLKSTPPSPEPEPEPEPPPDPEIEAQLDRIEAQLDALSDQQTADTEAILAAIAHFEARFNQVVEDAEETLQQLLPWLILLWRRDDTEARKARKGETPADAASQVYAWLAARKAERSA